MLTVNTPSRREADELRDFIARISAELIAEQGLEQATMREIAAKAGVSKGRIEHYFANKDELVDMALEWINQRYIERQERRTAGKRGLAALHARLYCAFPITPESRQEWKVRLQFWSRAGVNPVMQKSLSKRWAGVRDAFRQDLEEAIELGEARPGLDCTLTADLMMHLVAGASCDALIDPRHYNRRYLLDLIERTVNELRHAGG